jgi:hypothetical protein
VQGHFTHPLAFGTLASIPAAASKSGRKRGSFALALHSCAKSHELRIGQSSGAIRLIKVNIRLGTDGFCHLTTAGELVGLFLFTCFLKWAADFSRDKRAHHFVR